MMDDGRALVLLLRAGTFGRVQVLSGRHRYLLAQAVTLGACRYFWAARVLLDMRSYFWARPGILKARGYFWPWGGTFGGTQIFLDMHGYF